MRDRKKIKQVKNGGIGFFKSINCTIELIGHSKGDFDSYLRENFDDVIERTSVEIEEAINNGDLVEDHKLSLEIFENDNEWVLTT